MTDNEIIKALEICSKSTNGCSHSNYTCEDCYLNGQPMCSSVLFQDTLDLINRQKAEIERLEERIIEVQRCDKELIETLHKIHEEKIEAAKAEAIKEFAERLKMQGVTFLHNKVVLSNEIDNLVKEMVGDAE